LACMNYLGFLAANARFITFGFVLTMLSSYGQTFYVALYGTEIRAEFELSNGGFGAVYSFVSIVAAILLVWVGRLIDRVDLRLYTAVTLIAGKPSEELDRGQYCTLYHHIKML
jgi:hypothetical protein